MKRSIAWVRRFAEPVAPRALPRATSGSLFIPAFVLTSAAIGLGLMAPSLVQAQAHKHAPDGVLLDVVPSDGAAVPVEHYMAALVASADEPGVLNGVGFPLTTRLRRGVLSAPVPNVLPARWMAQPVFVLGADIHSQQWLQHNAHALQALGAFGLVVQADSPTAFKRLQSAGQGLPMAPARGPWLPERLRAAGVDVYPVLIQSNGTVQQIVPHHDAAAGAQR